MTELNIRDRDGNYAEFHYHQSGPTERELCMGITFRPSDYELEYKNGAGPSARMGVCLFASIEDAKALRAYLDVVIPILEAQQAADEVKP